MTATDRVRRLVTDSRVSDIVDIMIRLRREDTLMIQTRGFMVGFR
jgi:hypothetical protein